MQKRETVDTTRFTSNFFWETNFWMTTGSQRILLTIWFSDKVFFLSSSNCKCCWAIFASANWSSSCLCLNTFSTCFKKKKKRQKSYMYLCPCSLVLFQHKKKRRFIYCSNPFYRQTYNEVTSLQFLKRIPTESTLSYFHYRL